MLPPKDLLQKQRLGALVCHNDGDIESEIESILKRSKTGGFLQDRFEMLLSKDHPLYPRAYVCKMELEVF